MTPERDEPTEEGYHEVTGNRTYNKPEGGFWTSTYTPDEEYDSDWIRWCSTEGFVAGREMYLLDVEDDLDILEVDGVTDLIEVVNRYPYDPFAGKPTIHKRGVDFAAMAEGYDAMRLTEEGQRKTRLPGPNEPDLYGWDAESTLWFDWHFRGVEYYGRCENELPEWS